nr:EOG090X0TJE [Cyclestheria hislopi]
MIDGNCIKQFMCILGTVAKLGKSCVLRISPKHIYFIVKEPQTISLSPFTWCSIEECHFFSEYNMDGLNAVDNEIYLEFLAENVTKTLSALKVSSTAKSVKIKLTKKLTPCLTFEIDLPSSTSHSRLVVHDIPVSVIPRRLWDEYLEPANEDVDVTVLLPHMRLLRNIVDRMKNLANMATLQITAQGLLTLTAETDMVSVTSYFDDLHIEKKKDDVEQASITIELKKLSHFLNNEQVTANRVICEVSRSRLLHFNFSGDSYSLEYFLPAVAI